MSDSNCIFCKIAAKQIPSTIVHEDEHVVAFKDIAPQAPVHLILIPREHFSGLNELTEANAGALSRIGLVAKSLAERFGLEKSGWRLVANCGPDAGQTVFHLHFHLLGGTPMGGRMV
ncbi:MAG: histidine triad nucleotide-binding protein [Holophagaceae bacterium]|nr:histidine triad nucleotide-binding protein [Holophagaceae bacterium]